MPPPTPNAPPVAAAPRRCTGATSGTRSSATSAAAACNRRFAVTRRDTSADTAASVASASANGRHKMHQQSTWSALSPRSDTRPTMKWGIGDQVEALCCEAHACVLGALARAEMLLHNPTRLSDIRTERSRPHTRLTNLVTRVHTRHRPHAETDADAHSLLMLPAPLHSLLATAPPPPLHRQ